MNYAIIGSRGYPSTYGGYETLVRRLAPYLASEGHEVTVYCRQAIEHSGQHSGTGVNCVRTWGIDSKSLSTLTFGLSSTLQASGYDSALVLNIANGFWLPILRRKNIPTVVNTDGLEWKRGKWNRLGQHMFWQGARMTARHATRLICDSQAVGRMWDDWFDVQSVYVPYGADIVAQLDDDWISRLGLEPANYILVVARIAPENNVDLTLDAIEMLGPPAPRLVVVGKASGRSPTERRLRDLHASGRILWLGHVSDERLLLQLWHHCSAYIHGHSVGGTNPALLQALGAGAPTVALDTEFNREVLMHPAQMYDHNPSSLAERISWLISDSRMREATRRSGQELVRRRFQWTAVCERYSALLSEVQ